MEKIHISITFQTETLHCIVKDRSTSVRSFLNYAKYYLALSCGSRKLYMDKNYQETEKILKKSIW